MERRDNEVFHEAHKCQLKPILGDPGRAASS